MTSIRSFCLPKTSVRFGASGVPSSSRPQPPRVCTMPAKPAPISTTSTRSIERTTVRLRPGGGGSLTPSATLCAVASLCSIGISRPSESGSGCVPSRSWSDDSGKHLSPCGEHRPGKPIEFGVPFDSGEHEVPDRMLARDVHHAVHLRRFAHRTSEGAYPFAERRAHWRTYRQRTRSFDQALNRFADARAIILVCDPPLRIATAGGAGLFHFLADLIGQRVRRGSIFSRVGEKAD